MGIQYSVEVRNAKLDAVESTVGTSAILKIFEGTIPVNTAAADAGTVLATVNLPSDWMAAASGGIKNLSGVWNDNAADATGTAQYFRLYNSGATICHMQGTVTLPDGGGDLKVDSVNFTAGQSFTVTTFQLQAGNA